MENKCSDRKWVKWALSFEDRVSVTKKWRALPFERKKKKISPRCFAYNPLLRLTWTRGKNLLKKWFIHIGCPWETCLPRFYTRFIIFFFLYRLYNYPTIFHHTHIINNKFFIISFFIISITNKLKLIMHN